MAAFHGERAAKNPHYVDIHLITTCFIDVENATRANGATWAIMYTDAHHDGNGPAVMPERPELIVLYRDVFERQRLQVKLLLPVQLGDPLPSDRVQHGQLCVVVRGAVIRPEFCSYRFPCPASAGWADSRSA